MKLYQTKEHPNQWIAYAPGVGWVAFPRTEHGWEQRRPARGLDPLHLRQVPLEMARNTGAPMHSEMRELAVA